jgi:hypothetical protein
MKKTLNWITLKLMNYQIKKGELRITEEQNSIVKSAYENMVKNYKTTVMYLESNKRN